MKASDVVMVARSRIERRLTAETIPIAEADREPDDDRADDQPDGGRQAREDQLTDRDVVLIAVAEVEVQEHVRM